MQSSRINCIWILCVFCTTSHLYHEQLKAIRLHIYFTLNIIHNNNVNSPNLDVHKSMIIDLYTPEIIRIISKMSIYQNIIRPSFPRKLKSFLLHSNQINKSLIWPISTTNLLRSSLWFIFKFKINFIINITCIIQPRFYYSNTLVLIIIRSYPMNLN